MVMFGIFRKKGIAFFLWSPSLPLRKVIARLCLLREHTSVALLMHAAS